MCLDDPFEPDYFPPPPFLLLTGINMDIYSTFNVNNKHLRMVSYQIIYPMDVILRITQITLGGQKIYINKKYEILHFF